MARAACPGCGDAGTGAAGVPSRGEESRMHHPMRGLLLALWLPLLALPAAAQAPAAPPAGSAVSPAVPPAIRELVAITRGTVRQFYRDTVLASDLGLPLWDGAQPVEPGVYRVRDRKNRDLLRYAVVHYRLTDPMETIAARYLAALGEGAQRTTDKETGAVFLFAGVKDHCRLVTITPQEGVVLLTLERVERFTVPPRVYTAREQQVIRLLEELTAAYRAADRLGYTMEQLVDTGEKDEPAPPPVTWTVQFARPATLEMTATVAKQVALTITTKDGTLTVAGGNRPPDQRAIGTRLTTAQVPELRDDPAAELMLGAALLADDVDYLGLQPVGQAPLAQQVEIVLTYPDEGKVLRLQVDRQRQVITRAETTLTQENRTLRVTRSYREITMTAPPAPAAAPPPPLQPPAAGAVPAT